MLSTTFRRQTEKEIQRLQAQVDGIEDIKAKIDELKQMLAADDEARRQADPSLPLDDNPPEANPAQDQAAVQQVAAAMSSAA